MRTLAVLALLFALPLFADEPKPVKPNLKPIALEENQREMQFVHGNLRGAAYYKSETLVSDMQPDSQAVPEPVPDTGLETIPDIQTSDIEKRH